MPEIASEGFPGPLESILRCGFYHISQSSQRDWAHIVPSGNFMIMSLPLASFSFLFHSLLPFWYFLGSLPKELLALKSLTKSLRLREPKVRQLGISILCPFKYVSGGRVAAESVKGSWEDGEWPCWVRSDSCCWGLWESFLLLSKGTGGQITEFRQLRGRICPARTELEVGGATWRRGNKSSPLPHPTVPPLHWREG